MLFRSSADLIVASLTTGEFALTGDLTVENLIVTDTLTAQTIITEQELQIEDTLITCGVGNPADLSNLGVLDEHNDGGQVWGGLIRSKDDTNYYLLRDLPVKPLPSSDITNPNCTELGSMNLNQLNTSTVEADGLVKANSGVVLNQTVDSWLIRPEKGAVGQVLTLDRKSVV